jgi:hypothetical protein
MDDTQSSASAPSSRSRSVRSECLRVPYEREPPSKTTQAAENNARPASEVAALRWSFGQGNGQKLHWPLTVTDQATFASHMKYLQMGQFL